MRRLVVADEGDAVGDDVDGVLEHVGDVVGHGRQIRTGSIRRAIRSRRGASRAACRQAVGGVEQLVEGDGARRRRGPRRRGSASVAPRKPMSTRVAVAHHRDVQAGALEHWAHRVGALHLGTGEVHRERRTRDVRQDEAERWPVVRRRGCCGCRGCSPCGWPSGRPARPRRRACRCRGSRARTSPPRRCAGSRAGTATGSAMSVCSLVNITDSRLFCWPRWSSVRTDTGHAATSGSDRAAPCGSRGSDASRSAHVASTTSFTVAS